jgi:arylsulfatase A-like enzyme
MTMLGVQSGWGRVALRALALCAANAAVVGSSVAATGSRVAPNVVIVSVDTLRADHMSSYGYERETTPNIDDLIDRGVRFTRARTIEPLTSPALCSMLTSLDPHQHGASRNGLRMRSGLASLPKALQAHGYRTAAFVGNWTLRDKLSGIGEHFEQYEEVLTRRRWLGLVRSEATAEDLTERSLEWISRHRATSGAQPFLLWVHYVEPHAPYRLHREFVEQVGLRRESNYTAVERYDTEIAFVDHAIGELLRGLDRRGSLEQTVVVFVADHGESLGEHDYWGHGRHLYEPSLLIPMAIVWPERVEPRTVDSAALITDLAPTLLGLLGYPAPAGFVGYDWANVMSGAEPPRDRVTHYQAHRGSVISRHDSDLARRSGLLEVGVIDGDVKEIFRIDKNRRRLFDLVSDPRESIGLSEPKQSPTEGLLTWMRAIYDGLSSFTDMPPEPLDEESIEQLRSLGYVD